MRRASAPGPMVRQVSMDMTLPPTSFQLMIAQAAESAWASGLARSLASLPVQLHWPRSGDEAIRLVAVQPVHLAVIDDDLPDAGGRGMVRNIRRLGLEFPCLLVCRRPDERVLHDALGLDVYSVLDAEMPMDALTPMVFTVVRRVYRTDWSVPAGFN